MFIESPGVGTNQRRRLTTMTWKLLILVILVVGLPYECAGAQVWPAAVNATTTGTQLYLHPRHFKFQVQGRESSILTEAFERYTDIIFEQSYPAKWTLKNSQGATPPDNHQASPLSSVVSSSGAITKVEIYVLSSDQSLGLQTSETYTLRVAAPKTIIDATTVYGALRGLETLAQLTNEVEVDPELEAQLPEDIADALLSDREDDGEFGDYSFQNHREEGEEREVVREARGQGGETNLERHRHHRRHRHHHHHHRHHRRHRHSKRLIVINETAIYDTPRFRHRGLLIDTARHFLPLRIIRAHLDAMAMTKLNVLHWHITDDQSFPYVSERLPELSDQGAFSHGAVYTKEDVQDVVEYARARGIRVMPEFDTPGHVASFGLSHPELLTECFDSHGQASGRRGPLNPTSERTYTLLWQLLRDVGKSFPDSFIHLGGDEVEKECWLSNPDVRKWMADQGFGRDVSRLHAYHTERMVRLAEAAGKNAMVWQEAADAVFSGGFEGADDLPESVVVQVWKWAENLGARNIEGRGSDGASESENSENNNVLQRRVSTGQGRGGVALRAATAATWLFNSFTTTNKPSPDDYWHAELARITKTHRAVLSAPWYLNLAGPEETAWETYWKIEPLGFAGDGAQKERVIGGTACMWGELVDATNALQKTWPLAAAVAERLWSDESVQDVDDARERLKELRCRMLWRGVPAGPLGPGFCHDDIG